LLWICCVCIFFFHWKLTSKTTKQQKINQHDPLGNKAD
jgi:hypothetical protein